MVQLVSSIRTRFGGLQGEVGQGLPEYSLILVLVACVAFVALTFMGVTITSFLSSVAKAI